MLWPMTTSKSNILQYNIHYLATRHPCIKKLTAARKKYTRLTTAWQKYFTARINTIAHYNCMNKIFVAIIR